MTRTVLALSPHLDDAAFSCGGTLAMLADAGHRVIVATVFTRSVPHPRGFALACQLDKGLSADVDYMALRRGEDEAAMRILGAQPRWLDFPEAPHRGYGSPPELFGERRADDRVVGTLAPMLRALIDEVDPALILAPRAIGDHVDHHAVRDALGTLSVRAPLALWTDSPYAFRTTVADTGGAYVVRPDAPSLARKVEASCAYTSQIGFQFGGPEPLRRVLEAHSDEVFETSARGARQLSAMLPMVAHA